MRFLPLIVYIVLLSSCTSNTSTKRDKSSWQVSFSLAPKQDFSYHFRIKTNSFIEQELQSQKIENKVESTISLGYQFKLESNNKLSTILRIDDFIFDSKSGDYNTNFNVALASSSFKPDERALGALHKASVAAVIDKNGKVYQIFGVDKIKQRMYELVGKQTSNKEQIIERVNQYMTEDYFKKTIERTLSVFTDKKLQVGDTISKLNQLDDLLPIESRTVYTFSSINDENEAIVDFFSNVDIVDHSIVMQGSNVLASFKGKQKGTLTIDISTGLLRKSISRLKISGKVDAMGMTVPIEADLKTEIIME